MKQKTEYLRRLSIAKNFLNAGFAEIERGSVSAVEACLRDARAEVARAERNSHALSPQEIGAREAFNEYRASLEAALAGIKNKGAQHIGDILTLLRASMPGARWQRDDMRGAHSDAGTYAYIGQLDPTAQVESREMRARVFVFRAQVDLQIYSEDTYTLAPALKNGEEAVAWVRNRLENHTKKLQLHLTKCRVALGL